MNIVDIMCHVSAGFLTLGILIYLSSWNLVVTDWAERYQIDRAKIAWTCFMIAMIVFIISEFIGPVEPIRIMCPVG